MVMLKKISLLFLFLTSSFLIAQETPVHFKFSTKKISDCEYDLQFTAAVDEPWHIYSLSPVKDGPNPTVFMFTKSADYDLLGKTTESKPIKEFDKVFEMNVQYFVKTATFTQRIKLKSDKKITIKGKYEYQACTEEKCIFPPADAFEFSLQGTAACLNSAAASTVNTDAASTLTSVESVAEVAAEPAADTATIVQPTKENAVVSEAKPKEDGDCHAFSKFLLGLIAGLGAVLMPCIYSLIPLTVSFFVKRSTSRAAGIKNSLLYGFFIIITFVIPTMLITIAFGPDALSNIATNTWLNLFFFILFIVFALSFFGLFEITLPSSWGNKLDAKADKGRSD
jgi:thiol:disulfide interchange protein DsbD